ncbi:phage head closure protein [uncultured Roseobacter sp.]|uniref:phage head closure protein n=1 Tax=uncultured Roseobacter sp. TaxID=114847 RepID=UPI0026245069|nr:phage head closure protein [uncultured Roseobacter sp.]
MTTPRLNRKLVLEAPQRLDDGAGGYVETWQALGSVWAKVTPRSGRETAVSEVALSTVGYRITLRSAPEGDIRRPVPEQRFREGARLFHIQAVVDDDPDGRYLTCFATEEVAV